ncbi:MAG: hypothetical protein D6675_16130 [Gemmatimonadetes bacterium]|nr:MAG: hypothetical protein D6675_16130 [Gemmatimonadota bacterium]
MKSNGKKKRYVRKGSRTERLVREKFGTDLESFLREKREQNYMTDAEIAELLGVHAGTIQKNREKYNIHFRLAGKRRQARDREIYERMRSGNYTLQAVGDMFGLTRERVRQIFKEYERKLNKNGHTNGNGSPHNGDSA